MIHTAACVVRQTATAGTYVVSYCCPLDWLQESHCCCCCLLPAEHQRAPVNYQVDGVESMSVADVGVVVDAEFGLVVVDRTTVQVALGDVMLTFNGSEVRGSPLIPSTRQARVPLIIIFCAFARSTRFSCVATTVVQLVQKCARYVSL